MTEAKRVIVTGATGAIGSRLCIKCWRKALRKIELELDDQIVETLERFASRQNQSAAAFLARGVSNYTRGFLMMALEKWMPREQWEALWRGEGCSLCEAVAAPDLLDATGLTVIDLPTGRLRLSRYPDTPGHCIFICRQHVCEPYYLPAAEQADFFCRPDACGPGAGEHLPAD